MAKKPKIRMWSIGRGPGSLMYGLYDAARHWVNRRMAKYLLSRLAHHDSPARVLEAGSGPGFCAGVLAANPGVGVSVALDIDASALEAAPKDAPQRKVRGDIYRLPFADGTFDLVFNSSTMEHLPSFGAALREMARVTKDNGRIFIGVPYLFGPFLPFRFLPKHNEARIWIGKLFSSWQLCRACEEEGLEAAEVRFYFFHCFVGVMLVKPR